MTAPTPTPNASTPVSASRAEDTTPGATAAQPAARSVGTMPDAARLAESYLALVESLVAVSEAERQMLADVVAGLVAAQLAGDVRATFLKATLDGVLSLDALRERVHRRALSARRVRAALDAAVRLLEQGLALGLMAR